MAAELARAYLLPCKEGRFSDLRAEISRAVRHAKETCGPEVPIAILASETSLRYRFNIQGGAVQWHIRNIQNDLPQDRWVAVGFSAFVRDGLALSNMGYFFTKGELNCDIKRTNPFGDDEAMSDFIKTGYRRFKRLDANHVALTDYQVTDNKIKNGRSLARSNPPFITYGAPNGIEFEYRGCGDIMLVPEARQNSILLVSAWGLAYAYCLGFAKRPLTLINDSLRGAKMYCWNNLAGSGSFFINNGAIMAVSVTGEQPRGSAPANFSASAFWLKNEERAPG